MSSADGTWFPAVQLDRLSHRLACYAAQPVAIIPDWAPGSFGRLVVGVDGSAAIAADLVEPSMGPVDALCQSADRPGSLIGVGGRPVDAHHPLTIGSVGLRLLDRATHPVVVVPITR